MYKNDIFVNN